MTKEEIAATIKNKKSKCEARLRILYATFNKTELSVSSQREQELGEDTAKAKEQLQMLKDRQDAIGNAGHNRFCPCCGLKLPRGYFKKLTEEVREQEIKVNVLEEECNSMASEREHMKTNALTEEISKCEDELREIQELEKELRDAGVI